MIPHWYLSHLLVTTVHFYTEKCLCCIVGRLKNSGCVKAVEQEDGRTISAERWRYDLWQHVIPWHDFPFTSLLLCLHKAPAVSVPLLDDLCPTFAQCPYSNLFLHARHLFLSLSSCFIVHLSTQQIHFIPLPRLSFLKIIHIVKAEYAIYNIYWSEHNCLFKLDAFFKSIILWIYLKWLYSCIILTQVRSLHQNSQLKVQFILEENGLCIKQNKKLSKK